MRKVDSGIVAEKKFAWTDDGACVELRPLGGNSHRTVLWIPFASGADLFRSWIVSRFGGHHLWGILQLASRGYRILIPRLPKISIPRANFLTDDWSASRRYLKQLSSEDIVYSNHNTMLWGPLRKKFGLCRPQFVGLLYAGETLPMASAYAGIVAMTLSAKLNAQRQAPETKVEYIPWGVELSELHSPSPYSPVHGLTCGVTGRDYLTISSAYEQIDHELLAFARGKSLPQLGRSIRVHEFVRPEEMVQIHYRQAAYVLIILKPDALKREAVGCTNLLEAMSLGRPVIMTDTGALIEDLSPEKMGFGKTVPHSDPVALRKAVLSLWEDQDAAARMGKKGRLIVEEKYDIELMGQRLFAFLEGL